MKYFHVAGYSLLIALLVVIMLATCVRMLDFAWKTSIRVTDSNGLRTRHYVLSKGEDALSIYSMNDADKLLSCFAGRADIERVSLEMTDVGPVGIRAIASMPNVRLVSFSGDFGVNDETLLILAGCGKLESLNLTCTKVTATGVTALQHSCRDVKLNNGPQRILQNKGLQTKPRPAAVSCASVTRSGSLNSAVQETQSVEGAS